MEDPRMVDCPPTPEILPVSSTPPARLEVTYSSSSEEVDETTDGRRSPPPKCAICLGKCRQPSYTDSCRHQFCFQCLEEWSKVKPECPLCKQEFRSIVYYKPIPDCPGHTVSTAVRSFGHNQMRNSDMYHHLNFILAEAPRITYHTTLRVQPTQSELLQQLFMHQSSDVQRFVREFGNQPIPSRRNSNEWRQFIYVQRLYARPLADVNGRFRETSASYYRTHPDQLNRLRPWANRELCVMCILSGLRTPNESELFNLLETNDVDSPNFLHALGNIVPAQYRTHFQHELVNYARSPYDVFGYDRCVQYDPQFSPQFTPRLNPRRARSHVIISSSEAEQDDDDIEYLPPQPESSAGGGVARSGGNTNGNIHINSATTSSSLSGTSNTISNSNSNSNSIIISNGSSSSSSSGNSNANTNNSNTYSSVVNGRRAGRTQFRIEAHSSGETVIMTGTLREPVAAQDVLPLATTGTQTQVIEVNEDGTVSVPRPESVPLTWMSRGQSTLRDGDNISLSSSDSDECEFVMAQKPPHLRTPDHVVDLESATDSDVVFVDEGPVAGSQVPTVRSQQDQQNALKREATASCSEYNHGASTSSGYCGAMSSGGVSAGSMASCSGTSEVRTKYYARPILHRYTGGMGVKSIYEDSDTEVDIESIDEVVSPYLQSQSTTSDSSSHDEIVFRNVQAVPAGSVGRGRKRKRLTRKIVPQKGVKRISRGRGRDSSTSSSVSSSSSSSSSSNSNTTSSSSSTSSSIGGSIASSSSSTSGTTSSYNDNSVAMKRTGTACTQQTPSKRRKNLAVTLTPSKRNTPKDVPKARTKKGRKGQHDGMESKFPSDIGTTAGTSGPKSTRRSVSKKSARSTSTSKGSTKATTSKSSKRNKAEAKSSETRNVITRSSSGAGPGNRKKQGSTAQEGYQAPAKAEAKALSGAWGAREAKVHYFVETRPSSSPTTDVAPEDGAAGAGTRKLKSFIIKRCAYTKAPSSAASTSTGGSGNTGEQRQHNPGELQITLRLAPNVQSTLKVEPLPSTSGRVSQPMPNHGGSPGGRGEPVVEMLNLSSGGSDSDTETDEYDADEWRVVKLPSDTAIAQEQDRVSELDTQNPPTKLRPTLQSTGDQQLQLSSGRMLLEEESNSNASASLFAPTLNWSETGESEPPLPFGEDRLSSAAASPFSSVSFPPSTASVSNSPALSLAVHTPSPPVELIDVVGTVDTESPLPSSVVDIGTIEGTIDEIMVTEDIQGITGNTNASSTEASVIVEAPPVECGLGTGAASNGAVGAEVEL